MSNELTEQNNALAEPIEGMINYAADNSDRVEANNENLELNKNFIDTLKIVYATSPELGKEGAELGDWVLKGHTFGKTIKVFLISYGYQIIASKKVRNKSTFMGKVTFKSEKNYQETDEYKKFDKKYPKGKFEIRQGPLCLFYIPEVDKFAVFFGKATLTESTTTLINTCLSSQRGMVDITTKEEQGDNVWFSLKNEVQDGTPNIKRLRLQNAIDKYLNVWQDEGDDNGEGKEDDIR